jgi:hypothetical protein
MTIERDMESICEEAVAGLITNHDPRHEIESSALLCSFLSPSTARHLSLTLPFLRNISVPLMAETLSKLVPRIGIAGNISPSSLAPLVHKYLANADSRIRSEPPSTSFPSSSPRSSTTSPTTTTQHVGMVHRGERSHSHRALIPIGGD